MNILKSLFGKKESPCCGVKIEEVKVDGKPKEEQKNSCCK